MNDRIRKDKLVLFGAGKIGRSFIGQLFSMGGYEVVFIDVFKPLVDELNRRGNYNVVIKSDKEQVLNIKNVRALFAGDEKKVIEELSTAGISAVSVGINGLKGIFPILANGLLERYRIDSDYPLDIIIAENMRNADAFFAEQLKKLLPSAYPFSRLVGLIETSIGKMVPIMQKKDTENDMLQIFSEPYNTLILNKKGFRNPIPAIAGLAPKENMKAWVDRKLFIHNLGHCASAYTGFLFNPAFKYLYEALAVEKIYRFSREAMLEASEVLMALHPGEFTRDDLENHIDDLLVRFQNRSLGDTIFRVGCDLQRKLGPEDRLAGAIHTAIKLNLPHDKILFALVCACHFRAKDENGRLPREDKEFSRIYEKGLGTVLQSVCGFDPDRDRQVFRNALIVEERINHAGQKFKELF